MNRTFSLSIITIIILLVLGAVSCNLAQASTVTETSVALLPTQAQSINSPISQPTETSAPAIVPSLTSDVPSATPALESEGALDAVSPASTQEQTPEGTDSSAKQAVGFCTGNKVNLKIPDRDEDDAAPDAGWCGETSIQMALLHFGKNISQYEINKAGKPAHPDLWEEEIAPALDALGVEYVAWDLNNKDLNAFMTWIGEQLQAGHPVVLGLKIYPDETGWDNDHFVLAEGCDSNGITINTNNAGEGQVYVTYQELTKNFEDSYSFINNENNHYGWAIIGLR